MDSVEAVNDALGHHYQSDRSCLYDEVMVLLLYWENGGDLPGCVTEAEQLEELFRTEFNYHNIAHFPIPIKENCTRKLFQRVALFVNDLENFPGRRLGIAYYAGHGHADKDMRLPVEEQHLSVWASHDNEGQGQVLEWFAIQRSLGFTTAPILLILDCCFAGQASKGSRGALPNNVELLAACGTGAYAPEPLKPQSFTGRLIKTLRGALLHRRPGETFDVGDINRRLGATLTAQPFHVARRPGNKSTRLDPLPGAPRALATATPADVAGGSPQNTEVLLRVMLGGGDSAALFRALVGWLTHDETPSSVRGVTLESLVKRTESIHKVVDDCSRQETSGTATPAPPLLPLSLHAEQLSSKAVYRIKRAWAEFLVNMDAMVRRVLPDPAVALAPALPTAENTNTNASAVAWKRDFVSGLSSCLHGLQRAVETEILSMPAMFDPETLREALTLDVLGNAGFAGAMQARLISTDVDSAPVSVMTLGQFVSTPVSPGTVQARTPRLELVVEIEEGTGRHVVIEYRALPVAAQNPTLFEALRSKNLQRLLGLSRAMEGVEADCFLTPKCVGLRTPERSPSSQHLRTGIVFEFPGNDATLVPISLYELLRAQDRTQGRPSAIGWPTLGQRYRLAYLVSQALMRWHHAGWVHQGLSSLSIVFFAGVDGANRVRTVDYGRPYMFGFDHSRRDGDDTLPRWDVGEDADPRQLYLHPDRQGPAPEKRHTRRHDAYSLGVLLAEIARWERLEDMLKLPGRDFATKAKQVPVSVGRLADKAFGHTMGSAYREAALACLGGQLGCQSGDPLGVGFVEAFDRLVVHRLEPLAAVDGRGLGAR